MTEELRKQIIHKNKLYLSTLQEPDNIDLTNRYKQIRNSLIAVLKNTEIQYHSNELELHKNDIAKTWKTMKNIIGKENNNSNNSFSITINGKLTTDTDLIVNEFNNFFVDIGPTLAEDITCDVNPLTYLNTVPNSMVIAVITVNEVFNVIQSLKNSSPGWDHIPAMVLKQCTHSYIVPLTHIINRSFTDGVFPKELQLARIVPIFKSGDSSQTTNYRPISVLSCFSKIFEKIMYNHLFNFMEQFNIIYEYQFGFRHKHSTQQAIITFVQNITESLDSGDIVIGLFLDLKKAFDTVNHEILLKKLCAYGIRGSILQWFTSYLTDRSQYVALDDTLSDVRNVKCGVPQGSILGPLLFIIYMNDICNVSDVLSIILYADDTSLIAKHNNICDLCELLNTELEKLSIWLRSNKLSLNVQKSFYLVFHRARLKLNTDTCISMDGSDLNRYHMRY